MKPLYFLSSLVLSISVVIHSYAESSSCLGVASEDEKCGFSEEIKMQEKNVLGQSLEPCCMVTKTGFYRDGICRTGLDDRGAHVVCAQVTDEFLEFSKARGNDLTTPLLDYGFPGLKAGDTWCLCASRWKEAFDAGVAPPVLLSASHEAALKYVTIEQLNKNTVKKK